MKHPGPTVASVLILVVAVGVGLVISDDSAASSPALPQPMLSDLVIKPAEEHVDAYDCSAEIVDPRTGEILSEPRVLFRSGEDAKIRTGVVLNGEKARIDVFISADAEARSAKVRVELVGQEGQISVQQFQIRL